MFYIQPDECINCAICESICPVDAIWYEADLPAESREFTRINAEFFGDGVTGWGEPGGYGPEFRTETDHPDVVAWKKATP